jgi:glycosyltransferase involved in cell wall biosynthesis
MSSTPTDQARPRGVEAIAGALPSAAEGPIRVLHIITRLIVGGAQENTLLSVEGLDRLDRYEVDLASGVQAGREGDLLSRAQRTTRLVLVPELAREVNPVADAKALFRLYRLIRTGRYHIVHTHSSKAGVLGRIAAKLAGTPIVVHTLHSLVFHDYQPWVVNRLWWSIKKACAPLTDHFISVSQVIQEKATAARIAPSEKFSTVYSGMELDWYLDARVDPHAVKSELGIPLHSPVVGKIARLFELKGHDQLMDAAPAIVTRHPDVRFLLVGDGVLTEHIQNRAHDCGILDHFVFAGLVPRERIPEMISVMDVLVHTSLREGLARVLPQALAMGTPCVSFDIDGAREVVISGETGYLVPPNDHHRLADAVTGLLDDEDIRARMGSAGRKVVDPAFRAETMVSEIAQIYDRLVDRHRARVARFDRTHAIETSADGGDRRRAVEHVATKSPRGS